jgi:hypothetical protein
VNNPNPGKREREQIAKRLGLHSSQVHVHGRPAACVTHAPIHRSKGICQPCNDQSVQLSMSCRLYKKSQRVLVSRCPVTLQFALCCRLRAGTNATNRSARLMPWQSQVPTWLHLQGPRAQQTYSIQRSQCMRMQSPPTQPWMSSCCPMTMTAAVEKTQLPSGRRHPGLSRLWLQTPHLIALQLPMPPMTLRRGHPWQHRRLDSTRNLLSSLLERCCCVLAPSRRAKHSRTAFRSRSPQRLASRQQRRRRPPQAAQLLLGRQ